MAKAPAGRRSPRRLKRVLLVANARAAGGRGDRLAQAAARALEKAGLHVSLELPAAGDVRALVTEAAPMFERVVVCGGDGTVSAAAQGLVESGASTPLAILPGGTANDFATTLGIPTDVVEAAELAATGRAATLDAGIANRHLFLNAISGGAAAEISQRTTPRTKAVFGRFAYALTALRDAPVVRAVEARIRAGSLAHDGPVLFFAIANGRRVGGGSRVTPGARVDDGLLDVVVLPEAPVARLAGALRALRNGTDHSMLRRVRTARLRLVAPAPIAMTRDGEAFSARVLDVRSLPAALRVVVPPSFRPIRPDVPRAIEAPVAPM